MEDEDGVVEKIFVCPVCQKQFFRKSNLNRHMQGHLKVASENQGHLTVIQENLGDKTSATEKENKISNDEICYKNTVQEQPIDLNVQVNHLNASEENCEKNPGDRNHDKQQQKQQQQQKHPRQQEDQQQHDHNGPTDSTIKHTTLDKPEATSAKEHRSLSPDSTSAKEHRSLSIEDLSDQDHHEGYVDDEENCDSVGENDVEVYSDADTIDYDEDNYTRNDDIIINTPTKKDEAKKDPFVCELCDEEFYDISKFNLHAAVHTGEVTLACPICQKILFSEKDLRKHSK